VDAVAKNLRRGGALVMIVGDGIRSEAEVLLGDLHRYVRFEFTLALVEWLNWPSSKCPSPIGS
jgi:hypothetical protein